METPRIKPIAVTLSAAQSRQSRWGGAAASLALHAVLVGLLALGSLSWHAKPEAVHSVAAYVVHANDLAQPKAQALAPPVADSPDKASEPTASEPEPVKPDNAALEQAQKAAQQKAADLIKEQAAQAQEKEKALALQKAKAEQALAAQQDKAAALKAAEKAKSEKEAEKKAKEKQAAEIKAADEKAKALKAAADKKAAEQALADKHRAQAALAEKAAAEKADLASRKQREADLARQLAGEEHADALSAAQAGLLARYKAELTGRVQRAWIRPPGVRTGLKCSVRVTQLPTGTVTGVRVAECNADAAVRQSIEAAVYRASPLPLPSDPALFDRNLNLEFAPDE